MRYFFTAAILMITLFAKGQIVDIPDSNFKWKLVNYQSNGWGYPNNYVDANNDGEIQESEALAITDLNLNNYDYGLPTNHIIHDLTGIKSFRNLIKLNLAVNEIHDLDLSDMINLDSLSTFSDSIHNLNVANCVNLKTLNINYEQMASIVLHNMPNLITATLWNGNNNINSLDISNCPALKNLTWPEQYAPKRTTAKISNSGLEIMDSQSGPNTTIILEDMQRLKWIKLFVIDSLFVLRCDSLVTIGDNSGMGGITYIKLDHCPVLNMVEFGGYLGDEFDIHDCPSLSYVGSNNGFAPNLTSINIKNGVFTNLNLHTIPNLRYVCADDFEVINTINTLAPAQPLSLTINSYCSFVPGGAYNTIKGDIRLTVNDNACDSTDRGLQNVYVKLTDTSGQSYITSSDGDGKYKAYTYKGNYTITPYFPNPYFAVTPSAANILFDTANSLVNTTNFCIHPNGIHNDLEVIFLPTWPLAKPGFNAAYTLVYKNHGTTTLSGNVTVNFDNNKMNFVSASENVTAQSSGQLLWNYNNLQPFESRTINVAFNFLPPPVNNIGDTVNYLAVITPSDNDETTFDNIFILPQTVIGSFDPNDKQCIEGSKLDIRKIGDYLHYQIRFQNEGTDTAFNIVVADTLSDKLDWNTFEFIGSSHSCNPNLKNNKAAFIFENINLPYKAIDEPGSNGWVAFKIKPKPSVVIGDSLNNSAAIYFDFNLPVITNTATTIISSSSTPVPVKLEYFSVNKKENTNQLNWKASCTYGNAAFVIERSDDGIHFKAIGNINATSLRCQLPFNFTDNNPVAGKNYYRLKITDADGKSFYSKILVVGNNKAGIEITAVVNNTVYLNSNKQQTIQLKIVAVDGKEMLNERKTVTTGSNTISIQMKNIVKGIYSLIIYTNDGELVTKRFVK